MSGLFQKSLRDFTVTDWRQPSDIQLANVNQHGSDEAFRFYSQNNTSMTPMPSQLCYRSGACFSTMRN